MRPADGDVREQPGVRARIGDVGTAGQHGDGDAAGGQGAVVHGGVDAVGAAGDDGAAPAGQSAAMAVAICLP